MMFERTSDIAKVAEVSLFKVAQVSLFKVAEPPTNWYEDTLPIEPRVQ